MSRKLFRTGALAVAALSISLAACKDKKADDVLAQDSSLNKDLALANSDTLAQPQLKDVPVNADTTTPAPAKVARTPAQILTPRGPLPRTPARTVPAPAPVATAPSSVTASGNTVSTNEGASAVTMGTVSSGSTIGLYSGQRVCTNTNAVGDRFTASVAEAVQGSNGVTIPAGATVVLEITAVKRSTSPNDNIQIEMVPLSIGFNGKTYAVNSIVTYAQVDKVRDATRGDDARKVATGAAIGAIAGQIFGHHTKSTVIGAAAGAAAGAIAASVTTPVDGCVPSGGRITLRLNQAVMIAAG
ncbi:MAG: YMGG-like glycine zipper-containing protein [Gemmatimonadota bacterium]|nr:YMGG-like glycine zipper-containing protein [Gemmatimonadota bacterium]